MPALQPAALICCTMRWLCLAASEETSRLVRQAGANVLVAGSAVYGEENIEEAIKKIRG